MPPKVLIISSFPPRRCGIATYAAAQREELVKRGVQVRTLTFQETGEADYRFLNRSVLGLFSAFFFLAGARYEQIILHFTEELVWPEPSGRMFALPLKALQFLFLHLLLRMHGSRLSLYVHEITTSLPAESRKRKIRDLVLAPARRLVFHTEAERQAYLQCYPSAKDGHTSLVDHGANFRPKFAGTKIDARSALDIPLEWGVLLCIGFISPHKGLEEAIASFKMAAGEDLRLFIVGKARTESDETLRYNTFLKNLVSSDSRIVFHNEFVDDVRFDMWIKAADSVILPYREIWSSGVGARATILGTPVIARAHPNLKSQFSSHGTVSFYETNADLTRLMNSSR